MNISRTPIFDSMTKPTLNKPKSDANVQGVEDLRRKLVGGYIRPEQAAWDAATNNRKEH